MAYLRNKLVILLLLIGIGFFIFSCAPRQERIAPQKVQANSGLEFLERTIELRNPLPRDGEEVEISVIVRNRGKQEVRRVPVYFYDNLRVFSTEEVDLQPGDQRRLSARWRATKGTRTLSVIIDPAHHFNEQRAGKTEVSVTVLVK